MKTKTVYVVQLAHTSGPQSGWRRGLEFKLLSSAKVCRDSIRERDPNVRIIKRETIETEVE